MDEDFTFLSDGSRRQPRSAAAQAGQPSRTPNSFDSSNNSRPGLPLVTIPTFTEVHTAQQPSTSNALNSFFQPNGLLSAHKQQQQQQQQSTGLHTNGSSEPGSGQSNNHPSAQTLPYNHTQGNGQQQVGSSSNVQTNSRTTSITPQAPPMLYPTANHGLQGSQQSPATFIQSSTSLPTSSTPPSASMPAAGNAIIVSKRQTGNPVLKSIRNVRWVFGDIVPDYLIGANACALFLSLRYHLLHPSYILYRVKELQRSYALRILLVLVDIEDVVQPLADITKAAAVNDFTLICAWSPEEAGRYLETFKAYENKPAHGIQERVEGDYASRLVSALTAVRAVNRTDAMALGAQFGTLASIMTANAQQLSACPGIGPTKVQNLLDTFHKPFRRSIAPASVQPTTQPPAVSQRVAPGVGEHSTVPPPGGGTTSEDVSMQPGTNVQQPAASNAHSQGRGNQSGITAAGFASINNAHAAAAAKTGKMSDAPSTDMAVDGTSTTQSTAPASSKEAETPLHGSVLAQRASHARQSTEDQDMMPESGILEDTASHCTREDSDDDGDESHEGHELLHMASQIMLQVQAGALVTGTLQSEDEGSDLSDDLEQDAENI